MDKSEKEVLPFFIIVAGVMIFLYGLTLYTRKDLQVMPAVIIFSIAMAVHTILHWFYWAFSRMKKSALVYFYIQTALAIFLVFYTKELSLVFGLFLPLLGEEVGLFRSKKAVLVSILSNSLLIAAALLFYFNTQDFDPLVFLGIVPLVFFVIIYVNLYNRQSDAKLKAENLLKELKMSQARVEQLTIGQERQRMARELHDTLAQGLSGLILQLEAASVHLKEQNNSKADDIINSAMTKARETLASAREAIDGLRTENLSLSRFAESMQKLFEGKSIDYNYQIVGEIDLDALRQDHIEKIITEALTNCLKYSEARNVNLSISNVKNILTVSIRDDGKGFDADNIPEGHYGIKGIRERCEILKADFSITSSQLHGAELIVNLPCKGAVDD